MNYKDPVLPEPRKDIDFESLPWNLNLPSSHNYIHLTTTDGEWTLEHYDPATDSGQLLSAACTLPYDSTPLELSPATTSLNYGTTVWEGLKCFRTSKGRAAVFRPDRNHARFASGCEALCLPPPSYELFMRGVQAAVQANGRLVPPHEAEGTKLYVRPMMVGSGQQLGLYPSARMSLLFYVSPTGNYFKGKAVGGLKLHLETRYCRASRGGTGAVKCSGNYAVAVRPLMDAKKHGFDDNLFIDLETHKEADGDIEKAVLQELSAANVFLLLGDTGELVTPSLDRGTILAGVTRATVLELGTIYVDDLVEALRESSGNPDLTEIKVVERDVTVGDLKRATEVFITGTAAEIVPVASVKTGPDDNADFAVTFKYGATLPGGPVTAKMLEILRDVMAERRVCEEVKGWLPDPFQSAESFRNLEGSTRK